MTKNIEQKKLLRIASAIEKVESRRDNTWKLIVGTQELAPEDEAVLVALKGKEGHFVFAVQDVIRESDIPTEKLEFKNEKSPSQRLRAVLYRLWEADLRPTKEIDFELFYRSRMERIIEQLKEKLD